MDRAEGEGERREQVQATSLTLGRGLGSVASRLASPSFTLFEDTNRTRPLACQLRPDADGRTWIKSILTRGWHSGYKVNARLPEVGEKAAVTRADRPGRATRDVADHRGGTIVPFLSFRYRVAALPPGGSPFRFGWRMAARFLARRLQPEWAPAS